jgi:short subunit dehydrogenase-like uncharacterized protein
MIYGSYGYSGRLIADLAVERGLQPILAGRNATQVAQQASRLGAPHRSFTLESPAALDAALSGVEVVLHCAGPFVHTAMPMVEACMRRGIHYVDITGELLVFEALAARTREFEERGIMVLPGAGFDVTPSDCLAAHLAARLPGATHLALALKGFASVSRGTAATAIEGLSSSRTGMVRREGALTPVAPLHKALEVDFGRGPRPVVAFPWADVSTAWHSTGIPNIEVYLAMNPSLQRGARLSYKLGPLLRLPPVTRLLRALVNSQVTGPSDEERATGRSQVWGRVEDASGQMAEARLTTLDPYTLTAHTAVGAIERILRGEVRPGFNTPSLAFGADFILDIPTTTRVDL